MKTMGHSEIGGTNSLRCFNVKFKQSTCASVLIGLSLGIALSLVITPLIDESCLRSSDSHFSGIRSLQSEIAAVDGDTGDYEPKLNLEGKPRLQQKEAKPLNRPRFYSTELGIKEKLFVGVLSSKRSVGTTGVALNATLAHHVDKLVFFVPAQGSEKVPAKLPVVEFADMPELLKPFRALNYIGEHYVNEYDYFFLIPETVYIRGMKLKDMVSTISVSQTVYMGKFVGDSKDGSLYCNLGGGIVFSQTLLKAVIQNMNWCTRNSFSDDASDNIGRCVLHSAGIPCSRVVQGSIFSSFKLEESFNIASDLKALSGQSDFNTALTVYPVKEQDVFYKLHIYFTNLELSETHREIETIQAHIRDINQYLPSELQSQTWPIGVSPPAKPNDRFSVLRWDYFTEEHVYPDNDFGSVRSLTTLEKRDLREIINGSVTHLSKIYNSKDRFSYRNLANGYRRFDPTRGMEYVLDLTLDDRTLGSRVLKRMEVVRALGKVEMVPMPYVTENTRLVLLLPITVDNHLGATQFLKDFAQVCLEEQDNAILVLLFIYTGNQKSSNGKPRDTDSHGVLKNLVDTYNNKYQNEGAKISWLSIKNAGIQPMTFGAIDLVSKKFPADTLFVMCHTGMEIRSEYLNRARMNTIAGWQVFYPIPFVLYHPDIVHKEKAYPRLTEVNKNYGHFDAHNFDYFSFYNSDYQAGRKKIEKEIPIARSERDIKSSKHHAKNGHDVYQMFLDMKSVHLMRAVDPSLRVRYESKTCEPLLNADSYQHCLASWQEGLASRSQLASLLFQYKSLQQNGLVNV